MHGGATWQREETTATRQAVQHCYVIEGTARCRRRVAVIKARQRVMWRHSKHDTHNPAIIIPLALITGRVQSKLVEYEAYLSLSRCKLETFDLSLRLHKQRTQGFADCNMKTGRERELMESAKPRWRHDMSHAVNDLIKWTNWPDLAPITSAWPMVTV